MRDKNPLPSRLLLVTDRRQAAAPLDAVTAEAVSAGARWIWLRDRDMAAEPRRALAARLVAITQRHGVRLSIGGDVDLAAEVAADAVHLAAGASVAAARAQLGPGALIGISTHGPSEVAAAHAAGADYVTLSPIFSTPSKPGYGPALGLAALTQASCVGLPVVALGGIKTSRARPCLCAGGITTTRARPCLCAGAAGIAVMGEAMRATGRVGGLREVVRALSEALQSEAA